MARCTGDEEKSSRKGSKDAKGDKEVGVMLEKKPRTEVAGCPSNRSLRARLLTPLLSDFPESRF